MAVLPKDPLLTIAKVGLVITEILVVFSMVMIAIGAGAVLTVQRGGILADLAAANAPGETYPAMIAILLLVAGLLFLVLCFVIQLKRIADTVGQGDPFQPANADRLRRMAWFSLGIQGIELVLGWLVARYGEYAQAVGSDDVTIGIDGGGASLTGLALAVVLFILARVFRHGAAMRDDLEGTV